MQPPAADRNESPQPLAALRLSQLALVLANLVPAIGVVAFDWDPYHLLILYWLENAVLGVLNLPRMALAPMRQPGTPKLFLIAFFCVHYGMFLFAHLMLLSAITDSGFHAREGWQALQRAWTLLERTETAVAIGGLAISHTLSFFVNYIGRGEYRRTTVNREMSSIYPRILVMHLAIVLGAVLVVVLDLPHGVLIVLVALKIWFDLRGHRKTHARRAGGTPT